MSTATYELKETVRTSKDMNQHYPDFFFQKGNTMFCIPSNS